MRAAELNALTEKVIGAAIEVHREVGPGLLESAYEQCMGKELELRGLRFQKQLTLSISYKGEVIESAYRIDFVVENAVVVELKAVEEIKEVHKVQVLTYLRFTKKPIGLLMNFHSLRLIDGLYRIANNAPEA